jgi:hypothetical protein
MNISSCFHTISFADTPSRRLHTGVLAAIFILKPLLILLVLGSYSKSFWLTTIQAFIQTFMHLYKHSNIHTLIYKHKHIYTPKVHPLCIYVHIMHALIKFIHPASSSDDDSIIISCYCVSVGAMYHIFKLESSSDSEHEEGDLVGGLQVPPKENLSFESRAYQRVCS